MFVRPASWMQRLLRGFTGPQELAESPSFRAVAPYYDELMSSVPYRAWVDYVETLLQRFGAAPQTVLDLACGTGMVGAELRRRGYRRVFGVDLSEEMARVAVAKGRLPVAVQDARALGLKAEIFDLVVCLYDSLNYILETEGLVACLRGVRRALRPGGLLIFDLNTIRALALNLFTQDNLHSQERLLYSWRSKWDPRSRICTVRMWFRWQGAEGPHEFVEIHRQRGYSDEEVQSMLRAAGLTLLASYDAYSLNPVHSRSTRAFYVAQRW